MCISVPPSVSGGEARPERPGSPEVKVLHASEGMMPGVTGGQMLYSCLVMIVFATVVLPAIWSRKSYRRRAALVVLDRIVYISLEVLDRILKFIRRI